MEMECSFLFPSRIRRPLPPFSSSVHKQQQRSGRGRGRGRSLGLFTEPPRCQKMFVPGFGEASPEAKAARNLQDFFTFVAVKIVLAQLESYNTEAHEELMDFVGRNSLNYGDKFCSGLMRESPRHKALALRILEVRSAYAKRDFEWDNLKKLAFKEKSVKEWTSQEWTGKASQLLWIGSPRVANSWWEMDDLYQRRV